MRTYLLPVCAVFLLAACDTRVNVPASGPDRVVEKDTTIINPPAAKEEKKVEKNTTIVNPPAPSGTSVESKSSSTTTTTKP